MTISWRLGTAEPIQSSGEGVTVFWRLGTAFVSHEYEESGTPEYHGSGSVEINFGASATGGYFIIGEGNVEVDFGITSTGTYACIGSASVEVDISCSGSGEYGVYGEGTTLINFSASGTGRYEGLLSVIVITPSIVSVRKEATYQFTAIGYDAVGNVTEITGGVWTVDTGGTIDPSTGLFTAGSDIATSTITLTAGVIFGEATAYVSQGRSSGSQRLAFGLSIGI